MEATICSHCNNTYEDPRMLSCVHSFCLRCISENQSELGAISCPICHETTSIPDGGLECLPYNLRLKDLMQKDPVLQRMNSNTCEDCEKEKTLITYCKECDCFRCESCQRRHMRLADEKSHGFLSISNKSDEILKHLSPPAVLSKVSCPLHREKKLSYYCKTCKVPVCFKCTRREHNTDNQLHSMGDLSKCAAEINRSGAADELHKMKEKLEINVASIDTAQETIKDNQSNACAKISEEFDKLHLYINQRKQNLLEQCSQMTDANMSRLETQKATSQKLLKAVELTSTAYCEFTNMQLLAVVNTLNNRVNTLRTEVIEASPNIGNTSILLEFEPQEFHKSLSKLGCIAVVEETNSSSEQLATPSAIDPSSHVGPKTVINGIKCPKYIAASTNHIFITNTSDQCIKVFDHDGNPVGPGIGSKGNGKGEFLSPHGIDIIGEELYVCDRDAHKIQVLRINGAYVKTFGEEGSENCHFKFPNDVKTRPVKNSGKHEMYVVDTGNSRIQVFNLPDFSYSRTIDGSADNHKISNPKSIAFDGDGNLYVSASSSVFIFKPNGQLIKESQCPKTPHRTICGW